jgi:chromosome segregation ATPase
MTTLCRRTFLFGISCGALALVGERARAEQSATDMALEELIQKFQTLKDKTERIGINLAQLEKQQPEQKSGRKQKDKKKLDQSSEYKKKLDQAIEDYRDFFDHFNPLIDRIADTWKNHSDKFSSQEYQADIQSIDQKQKQLVRDYNAVKAGNMQRGEALGWLSAVGELLGKAYDWFEGEKAEGKNKEMIDRLLACKIRQYEMLPT